MNGDGRLDAVLQNGLVALNRDGRLSGLRLLPRTEADYTFGYANIQDIDVGDLNGDAVQDVLVTTKYNLGSIFISNGDGTFQQGREWQFETYIRQSEIVDLDGDGDRDILHRHDDSGDVDLMAWLNDGTGHVAGTTGVDLPVTGSSGLVAADFDADGDIDALTSDFTPAGILYLNDGTGSLVASPCSPPFGSYLPVGGDARPGRFSTSGANVQVERMTGTCTLDAPIQAAVGTIVTARFADVNNDGCTDAVCLLAGDQVSTVLGQPGGGWSAPIPSPGAPIAPGYTPVFASIGDLDGDGLNDLVFTGAGPTSVISAMRNLGGGVFGERGDSYTNQPFGTVIGDVDNDGAGDLLGVLPHGGGQESTRDVSILFGIAADQPTPVLVSLASAVAYHDHASLAWQFPEDVPAVVGVERRAGGGGWSEIARVAPSGDRIVYEDRAVEPGARYDWRISWTEDGAVRRSDIASLAIPARASFAIAGVFPNPSDGERVRVMLSIDRAAPVEVRLIDVSGRVVASQRIETPAIGARAVDLGGLAGLRAGLYFVRAEQGGRQVSKTVVRLE